MSGRSSRTAIWKILCVPERNGLAFLLTDREGRYCVPTVAQGADVQQMEKRGIQADIGNLNREIRAANSLVKSVRQLI